MEATRRFALSKPEQAGNFPRLVIGSDEVWNQSHPWYGGRELFFGEGLSAERRIAYAVSVGNQDPNDEWKPVWRERLARFDRISVRDANTARFVTKCLGTSPDRVADPCLCFPLPLQEPWNGPTSPFAVVYGHGFSRDFAAAVRTWAASRGITLVSIGYRNNWADRQWITASPQDFAHAMAKAQAVATNFFHGGVFALRNRRPFVCETTPYRAAKLLDLLQTFGCESHRFQAGGNSDWVNAKLDQPLPAELASRIESTAQFSTNWLATAIR
jgi:hypothetical protein